MAEIFVAWYSPDQAVVEPLIKRLRGFGFDVWDYGHDMAAGDTISEEVRQQINQAYLAILCTSDASVERPWCAREAAYLEVAFKADDRPLQHIIPVKVGTLDREKVPGPLKELGISWADLSEESTRETSLHRLADDVQKKLGQNGPVILPAALFAMNAKQFQELVAQHPPNGQLQAVCTSMGMKAPPDLFEALAPRYGETSDEFKPFAAPETLKRLLEDRLRSINMLRLKESKRLIRLRWVHQELTGNSREEKRKAQDLWTRGDSLLIVDSISTYHSDVVAQIHKVPESAAPPRAAILWVPPYSRHTAPLEEPLMETAEQIEKLGTAFRNWHLWPRRWIAFDIGTSFALRLWLHRAFADLPDVDVPFTGNVESMMKAMGKHISIRPGDFVN